MPYNAAMAFTRYPALRADVFFTLAEPPSAAIIKQLLDHLRDTGEAFLTPTHYNNTPGIRAAFSNWRTEAADVARVWQG